MEDYLQKLKKKLPGGQETILLVEDDEVIRRLVKTVLAAVGYTVVEAQTNEETQQVLAVQPVHLLLADIQLADERTSGLEIAQEVKRIYPSVKILLMSGSTSAEPGVTGIDFLTKPFDQATLAKKVRQVLDGGGDPQKEDS